MTTHADLRELWCDLQTRLGHLGQVWIAGGAVRDIIHRREPRDWDVFINHHFPSEETVYSSKAGDWKRVHAHPGLDQCMRLLAPYPLVDRPTGRSTAPGTLVGNWYVDGKLVQLISTPFWNVEQLMAYFDWDICRYAYGAVGNTSPSPVAMCSPSSTLQLGYSGKVPSRTLERGLGFCLRFDQRIDEPTLRYLLSRTPDEYRLRPYYWHPDRKQHGLLASTFATVTLPLWLAGIGLEEALAAGIVSEKL